VSGGCCGLAGSWGFEQGKYEISLDCGEQALLPAIRDNPDALVVANGFSCQTQISDSGTAKAVHLGQVMAMADKSADLRTATPPSRPQPDSRTRIARTAVPAAALGAATVAGALLTRKIWTTASD
jgi:hypothetical protein